MKTAARTGDASTSLKMIFDADKVKKEIEAQVTITQEFGKQAGKAITDYTIHPDWMVYGKLSLNRAHGEFTDTGAPSGTTQHSGQGLGLGVATQFSNRWVGRFEVSQVNYSREPGNLSTGKPKSKEANISIGYRF